MVDDNAFASKTPEEERTQGMTFETFYRGLIAFGGWQRSDKKRLAKGVSVETVEASAVKSSMSGQRNSFKWMRANGASEEMIKERSMIKSKSALGGPGGAGKEKGCKRRLHEKDKQVFCLSCSNLIKFKDYYTAKSLRCPHYTDGKQCNAMPWKTENGR
eukprot:CAMPEP_0174949550 /NCGR_PEP_ID=MMETSP1355-20121228/91759_1 /TAXON_ID=464990 /ORGANISM="Hemiselmis tepida, Strain CCMP443" /LENGTH=158 /DNA_ID=CAMNT_0016197115 /DNA_START=1 /DNA_END=474 /DNA_ORIENTATION=-